MCVCVWCTRTHSRMAFGPPCGVYVREVALLGAPGCVQTVVTEQRRQQQPGSGEERSGAMPRRFPLRDRRKGRKRQTEREGEKHGEGTLI